MAAAGAMTNQTENGGAPQPRQTNNNNADRIEFVGISETEEDCNSLDDEMEDTGYSREDLEANDVTAQLMASGPVGMAAAAAIASSKSKRRPFQFETNPSVRKRQQNRLLRKLKMTIDELAIKVGQQAVVLVCTPGAKPGASFRVFGAKPLEDVVRGLRDTILEDLEAELANQAPPPSQDDPSLFELPPLVIDGIPTPLEQMTQAQLRMFIPLMLKYSTGRGKPRWGRESSKPPWWPNDLPWANVRMDVRPDSEKVRVSWTHALRQIVRNCYTYHGREDLLPAFKEGEETEDTKNVKDGIQIDTGASQENNDNQVTQYVLHAISNPDGTVSIVQVDPNNPIITLPDGTTAQIQGEGTPITAIQSIDDTSQIDLSEQSYSTESQIILTTEDGVVYQTVVGNIQQFASDGSLPIKPKTEPQTDDDENMEEEAFVREAGGNRRQPRVVQVVSLQQ